MSAHIRENSLYIPAGCIIPTVSVRAGLRHPVQKQRAARADPDLYRRAHSFAIEHRPEAEKYYHVSTNAAEIPDITLQNDAYLPEYLNLPASRQTVHIAYGLLLTEPWFREEFFRTMDRYEEEYYRSLEGHLGKHIRILTGE